MPPNNTIGLAGRFCNHLIRNLYVSFLAERNDTQITYSFKDEIAQLGIPLFSGKKTYPTTLVIRDDDAASYLDMDLPYNLFVDWTSAQNPSVALRIYNYFRRPDIQASIIDANHYKHLIGKNNAVFVHIRLDDAAAWSPGYAYYDAALAASGAKGGFLSSDSSDHPFVTSLAAKYNLSIVQKSEVETLMFASTCKHIILSYGTFSWMIGALAFDATVVYPPRAFGSWCGDIFSMPGWKIVDPS